MTAPARLPAVGEAEYWWYCPTMPTCGEAREHDEQGRCKVCGKKAVHIPREGENGKHRHTN